MQHKTTTLANGKIVLATVGKHLSLDDWAQVSQDIMDAVQQAGATAHVIVDMRGTKTHPMNALEIHRVTTWAKASNIKTVNHITESRITTMLGDIVIGLVSHAYRSMKTLEEAFQRIVDSDETISESAEELMQQVS